MAGNHLISCLLIAAAPASTWRLAAQVGVNRVGIGRRHTETSLGSFPQAAHDSAVISPDGRRIAYVRQIGDRQAVVVDGRQLQPYHRVAAPTFSPDSKWLAYAASSEGKSQGKSQGKWYIVINQREQGPYERVGVPVFGPASGRLVHVALLPDGKRVVIDNNRPSEPYDEVFQGRIEFSPDGRRIAYGVRGGQQWQVLVDGRRGPACDFLGSSTSIRFSPDGGRLAYAAWHRQQSHWRVMVDQRPQQPYRNIGQLVFSPDGKRLAYAAMLPEGRWLVVVDGRPQKPYEAIGEGTLRFGPQGRKLAYAARSAGKWLVVVDAQEGRPYEGIGEMRFGPHGRRLAYAAELGEKEMVVVDGRPGRTWQQIGGGTLVFSPDGTRLGYAARSGRVWFVVIDGNRNRRYEMVGYLSFTPDGRRYVYAATRAGEVFTVVDGQEGAHRYDAIWNVPDGKLLFDTPRKFHYLAIKKDEIFLVEEELD